MGNHEEKQTVGPKMRKNLGYEVEVTSKQMPADAKASTYLSEAGRSLERPGLKYEGSAAVHFYSGSIERSEFAFQNQINLGGLSEQICAAGTQQFNTAMLSYFGKKPRSVRR